MRYTHVEVTDWFGLYCDGVLLREGHELSVSELAHLKDDGAPFSLEVVDGRETDLDTHISQVGGFAGLPLDRAQELAE